MAVCPHCGDEGAPPRGWCLLCGQDVSLPVTEETRNKLAGYDGSGDLPTQAVDLSESQAPRLDPIESQPLEETGDAPEFEPLEFVTDEHPPVASPAEAVPVAEPLPVIEPTPPPIELPPIPTLQPSRSAGKPTRPPPRRQPARSTTRRALDRAEEIDAAPVHVEPHAALSLQARYEYSSVPADDPPVMGVLVEIEAAGKPLVSRSSGPVAHVILALDLSASMNEPDKYPVLKDAIRSMLADLHAPGAADVLLSAVIFSKGAETLFKGVPARRINPDAFFRAIEQNPLCFGRYTDIGGALSRAGRIAYDQTKSNPRLPVRMYLLTDGRPQDVPRALNVSKRLGRIAADIHGLAFGEDADVGVLQELFAGKRGGTVKSVREETIGSAFERVAEVAQKVLATRCRVQLDLEPGVVGGGAFRYRPARVRFPEPAFQSGKRFAADLGTIEKGRTYSLLFEVRPPETHDRFTKLGNFTVQIPGERGPISESIELTMPRTDAGSDVGDLDGGVRTARDILGALTADDPQTALRALRLRRQLYEQEKRDRGLLQIIDTAIELLEKTGSLDGLSPGDYATLLAHTCTSGTEY